VKSFLRILIGLVIGAALALGGIALYGRFSREAAPVPTPTLPEGPAAVITHLAGPVFLIRGEEVRPAVTGDRLEPGDIVKVTDGAVAQVQLADRGTAKIGSDTLVRFRQIAGADVGWEVRTEILTGSLSYRVDKLGDDDTMIIEADGTLYEVRGTEFYIEKRDGSTLLAVKEGTVSVAGDTVGGTASVTAGEELRVDPLSSVPAAPAPMGPEAATKIQEGAPMPAIPFPTAAPMVQVVLVTEPADAIIYLDGLKTGVGTFRGLFVEGTELRIRVRRRGFRDADVVVKADRDISQVITLLPSDLEESLAEPRPKNPLLEQLREDYEKRLLDLRLGFESRYREDTEDRLELAEEKSRLEDEIAAERALREAEIAALSAESAEALNEEKARTAEVEGELESSRREISRLQELLTQIREISEND
jgi:hypothetical protein